MNHNIKGTGLSVSADIREYLERKLQHLDKFVTGATVHCDCELQFNQGEREKKCRAEFTLRNNGDTYRAEARGDTIQEAIDLASDELARELSSHKDKKIHVLRRSAVKVKEFLRGWRRSV